MMRWYPRALASLTAALSSLEDALNRSAAGIVRSRQSRLTSTTWLASIILATGRPIMATPTSDGPFQQPNPNLQPAGGRQWW